VADGKIMQHSIKYASNKILNSQTCNFNTELQLKTHTTDLGQCGFTEFSVYNSIDITYFSIGKFDGSIELYSFSNKSNEIKKMCTFLNHNKLITTIKWNKRGAYLASGSNDFNIVIVDFLSLITDFNNNSSNSDCIDLKFVSKYKHKLVGHKERITSLNWSSFDDNLLVSSSYDATVQVRKKTLFHFGLAK
jgi:WD40 repeat protein